MAPDVTAVEMRTAPGVRALFVIAVPVAVLTVTDILTLWWSPSPAAGLLIWEFSVGSGLAAAGIVAVARRDGLAARLLLLGGTLLLLAPSARAAGADRAGAVVAASACAVIVPLGLMSIPARRRARRVLRALDLLVLLSGTVCVTAVAAGTPAVGLGAAIVVGVALFSAGWVHFELSAGDARRQVLWLILGFSTSAPLEVLYLPALYGTSVTAVTISVVLSLLSLVLPLTAAIAVIAPTALDVRVVISRFVVALVMIGLTVATTTGVLTGLEQLIGSKPNWGVLGIIVVAIAACFHPVMTQVKATTEELLFGGRADPVDTLSRLGTELSAGTSPQEWLTTLRATLAVPAIALRVGGEILAEAGPPASASVSAGSVVTELRVGPEHVGDLVVALPEDRHRLPATTHAVLRLVAAPLAQAVHAMGLAEQLRASRVRVVAVLEEERRRVRRDLHDGLGPTLTGIAYSADAAANLLHTDPDRATFLLHALRADAADAIAEIRRIVYGLRPQTLDELGLVAAVRQQVSHLLVADGRPLRVDVQIPHTLPPLPAAVEVVAYRMAVEALTNVARHAGVDRAHVTFNAHDQALTITVHDPGTSTGTWLPGVGLNAMRERVEEVGGTLTLTSGIGGSTVHARVPLVVQ
jgi:signal transduction histidine kinase